MTRALAAAIWLAGLPLLWLGPISSPGRLLASVVATYFLLWGLALTLAAGRDVWLSRLVLCSGSITLVIAVLETPALLGVADYRVVFDTPLGNPIRRATMLYDADLLHVMRPHTRLRIRAGGDLAGYVCLPPVPERYEIRYDHMGFRNASDLSRADVVMIGDSFLEAGRDTELVSAVLGRMQARSVANLGQSRYGPQQELVVLRRFALPLRPGLVVWMFFEGNDLDDLRRYDSDRVAFQEEAAAGDRFRFRSFSYSALMTGARLLTPCEPLRRLRRQAGWLRGVDGTERLMYFGYPAQALSRSDLAGIARMRGILAEAHRLIRAYGGRLVVAFIPTKFRVYHDLVRSENDSHTTRWMLNDLPDRMARLVGDIGPDVAFVDLTPPLRAAASAGRMVYALTDTHWSAEGHRVAAEAIATVLR